MAMAKSAMIGLNKIWTDRGITKATKKRLVSALIFPIATYGCESWTLTKAGSLPLKCGVGGVCYPSLGLWKDQTSAFWRRYNQKGVYYLMSKAIWWNILDTLQDEVETPWRKSLCKVVSKGEGSLEDLEPDGSTKSNLWSDAPFMSFTTLSRIVRGGVMLLQSRAVSHGRIVPTYACRIKVDLD